MALDRGKLAKIDRRVFSELDHGVGVQTVKVPLSDAAWSTWRRYCDVIGLTMGEGIASLIDSELAAVVDGGVDQDVAVFASRVDERLAAREAQVAARERDLEVAEGRQRGWSGRLRRWEGELEAREMRVQQASKFALKHADIAPKIGRNDRCPCGSGLKHKHCHGLPGRQHNAVPR